MYLISTKISFLLTTCELPNSKKRINLFLFKIYFSIIIFQRYSHFRLFKNFSYIFLSYSRISDLMEYLHVARTFNQDQSLFFILHIKCTRFSFYYYYYYYLPLLTYEVKVRSRVETKQVASIMMSHVTWRILYNEIARKVRLNDVHVVL